MISEVLSQLKIVYKTSICGDKCKYMTKPSDVLRPYRMPRLVRCTHKVCVLCNDMPVSEYDHDVCINCVTATYPEEYQYHHKKCNY